MKFTNLTAKPKMDWTAAGGTCLQGYIDANYADLCEKLGAHSNGDEYKVDAEWVLRFSDGTIATVYNYKDGKNYCGEDGLDVTLDGSFDQLTIDLEVDGGIGPSTIAGAAAAGANVLVAGSALYRDPEGLAHAVSDLRARATAAYPH